MRHLIGAVLLTISITQVHGTLCPYQWMQHGNSCYYFSNSNYTRPWVDARARCLDMSADLVSIDSIQERDWLISQLQRLMSQSHTGHDWWVGFNVRLDGRTWTAANGTQVSIDVLAGKWISGQPRVDINTQCVDLRDSKFLVDRCTNGRQHICERAVGQPLTCESGWLLFGNMCYRHFNSPVPYDNAKSQCQRYGGTLPEIWDINIQTNVWDWARQHDTNIWLDLKTTQLGGNYVFDWGNGTTLTSPTYWQRGLPRLGANTCAELIRSQASTRCWNPIPCNQRRQYTCLKPEGTCPPGWLQFFNQCYKIYTGRSRLSWTAAKTFCTGLGSGANLAIIYNGDYMNFLKPYIRNSGTDGATSLWFGISDNNETRWRWVNNGGVGYQNWIHNPPNNVPNKQDCAFINTNDPNVKWQTTANCGTPKNFICQVGTNHIINTATPAPAVQYSCPRGYVLYKTTCFKLVQQDKTWDQAQAVCKADHHGDLARIPDRATSNFISTQIRSRQGNYWIGLQDRQIEGTFRWLNDTTNAQFFNWHAGEPNNFHGNENCAFINGHQGFKWYDASCATRMHFVCQINANRGAVGGVTATTRKPWSANCGPFWEDDPNSYSCYMFNTNRLSWLDARSSCQSRGGDLLCITSLEEQFYINGRIGALGQNFFWIGANDRATETGWRWSDGSPMAFVNWKAGEPNNQGNQDCVAVSRDDGRWTDFQCNNRYSYICEKIGKATPPATTLPTSPASLPAGKAWGCPRYWRGFQGYCFGFIRAAGDFQTARTKCGQNGGTLASIHSEAENKFVFSLLPRQGYTGNAWIGFTDITHENSFGWTDGSPVTYTKWANQQPDNHHNEDCVVTFHNGNGAWGDTNCNGRQGAFFCKKPMSLQDQSALQIYRGCNSGGLGYRAQCYVYIASPTKNWQQAQADCRRRHGNLATVTDMQIQAFLSAELAYRGGVAYWIGLKNFNRTSNSYVWATNYTFDFTSWSEKHTGNERGSCVAMITARPRGLWGNFPCGRSLPYICEYPRTGFTTPPPTPPTTTPRTPCPGGWKAWGSQCFKAFNLTRDQRLSWTDARSYCRNLGGDLVTIRGKPMETWLYRRVLNNVTDPETYWWIGLNDRDSEQGHVWSDGSGVTYVNWAEGEPNDYGNREDCVEWVLPRNGWNDQVCDIARNFICSVPRGVQITTTATPPVGVTGSLCKNTTFLYYAGYCYYLSPETGNDAQKTWYDARATCNQLGGDLASVQSVDENSFLTYAMSRHRKYFFWIGLNDLDGTYKWTDGSPVSFISWKPDQPDDFFGGESCVESTERGDWNDNNCQDKKAYICKQLPGQVTPKRPTIPTPVGGCPAGFTSIPILSKCYKVAGVTQDTLKNFTDAFQACNNMSPPGKLVSIHNYIEERYLVTLTSHLPHPVWIGLYDIKRPNYFEWHDNSAVDYTHWGPGQPDENIHSNNPDDRRDCVMMNTQPRYAGNWNDQKCANKLSYVCQTPRVASLPTLAPFTTGCSVAGYTNHQGNCYKYIDTPMSWQDAQSRCQQDGANIASATDRFMAALVGLLRMPDIKHARNVSEIWLGMSFNMTSRALQWTNGWPIKYTKWARGEPDETGNCVKMDQIGSWHDHPCDTPYPFVCQINTGTPPPATTTVSGTCLDSTWSPYGEYCYQLKTDRPRSFPESRYMCELQGAKLASIHSQQEMGFIQTTLFQGAVNAGADSTVAVWIGLSKGYGGGFAWADNTELEFENWAAGEPSDTDSGAHQDCVQASMTNGAWNDVDCFDANYYVCKTLKQSKTSPRYNMGTTPGQYRPPNQGGQNPPNQGNQGNQNPPNQGNQGSQNPPYNQGGNVNPPYNQGGNQGNQNPPYNQGGNQDNYNPPYNQGGNQGNNNPPYNQGGNQGYNPPYNQGNQGNNNPPYNQGGNQNLPNQGNTGAQTSGNSGSSSSSTSLSGGAVAGIVVGVLAIVVGAGVAVYFIRSRNLGHPALMGGNGFDNALYSKGSDKSEGGKGSVSFGYEDDGEYSKA